MTKNVSFDELPYIQGSVESLDWSALNELFLPMGKELSEKKAQSIGLLGEYSGKVYPTFGGILLFGRERRLLFPDAVIKCARFNGIDKIHFLDHSTIDTHLPLAVDEVIEFVKKHSRVEPVIEAVKQTDIPQYPVVAVRGAITNALVHADYSIECASTYVDMFDDRIEITNPGGMPFGLTLEGALEGYYRLRNRVIGKVFFELNLMEQWGTGLKRIIDACIEQGLERPKFVVAHNNFKIIIYSSRVQEPAIKVWQQKLLDYITLHGHVSIREASQVWSLTTRSARIRLKHMSQMGLIIKISTSPQDPLAVYVKNIKG